jgi:translation elongation factor EF-G
MEGGFMPKESIPSVMKTLEECMGNDILVGYFVVDLQVILTSGSYQ